MKVKLLTGISGERFVFEAGETAEFSADEAARLIAAGAAVPVGGQPETPEARDDAREKRRNKK